MSAPQSTHLEHRAAVAAFAEAYALLRAIGRRVREQAPDEPAELEAAPPITDGAVEESVG